MTAFNLWNPALLGPKRLRVTENEGSMGAGTDLLVSTICVECGAGTATSWTLDAVRTGYFTDCPDPEESPAGPTLLVSGWPAPPSGPRPCAHHTWWRARIRTVFTSAPTPSHQLDWSLPPGITIDTSKLPDAAATRNVVGVVFVGGSTSNMGVVKELGGGVVAQLQGGGSNLNSSDAFIAAVATIRLDFSVPVNP